MIIGLKRLKDQDKLDKLKVNFEFKLLNKNSNGNNKIEIFENCLFEPEYYGRCWIEDKFVSYFDLENEFILNDKITIELIIKSVKRL